jgi:Cof subfamily protein (haloacid dehalogenase superfamily)
MKSKKMRILALDLDDTALHSDISISKPTRNTIKQAEKEGATVVLASSRIPEAIGRYVRLLGLDKQPGYIISKNGALITESNTGKIIHEARLDVKSALAICDLALAENFPIQIYEDDIMYVSKKNEYTGKDQKLTGIRHVVVENFRAMVAEGCHKLIIAGEPSVLSNVKTIIENFMLKDVTLYTNRPNFLEIMPRGADKRNALALIAEILGVDADQIMVIGDSMNDEAVIRLTGTGMPVAAPSAFGDAIEKYFVKKDVPSE